MSDDEFWKLIDKAKAAHPDDVEAQLIAIQQSLTDSRQYIGFECTLREKLIDSYSHGFLAAQAAINPSISDDAFLYFRCHCILKGRQYFEALMASPENVIGRIDDNPESEGLLYVASKAASKAGIDNLRDNSAIVVDYDFGRYNISGTEWVTTSDLRRLYPKLYWAYPFMFIVLR